MRSRETGAALVVTLMAMLLLSAIGAGLVLATATETLISANFRRVLEGRYAAESGMEHALDELLTVANWDGLLDGSLKSAFVDGPPAGIRRLADGTVIDLLSILNDANCGKAVACTPADMDATTSDRPWGANNPRWQLYSYGPLADLEPAETPPFYVVVMVADDPSENDGDPLHDGVGAANPGRGVLMLRAETFGPRGARKGIEAAVARVGTDHSERGYTGQRGEDAGNRNVRDAAIRTADGIPVLQRFDVR
jgi:hypothetical protein